MIAVALLGCGEPTGTVATGAASGGPVVPARSAPSASESTALPGAQSGRAVASAPASAVVPAELVGVWRGEYESNKTKVTLDVGVMEPSFVADRGKAASGKGTVELTIGADGGVTGSMKGPLGEAIVTGAATERAVDVSFTPIAPDASPYMTGVLALTLEAGALKGSLRASSGDATLARGGPVELTHE